MLNLHRNLQKYISDKDKGTMCTLTLISNHNFLTTTKIFRSIWLGHLGNSIVMFKSSFQIQNLSNAQNADTNYIHVNLYTGGIQLLHIIMLHIACCAFYSHYRKIKDHSPNSRYSKQTTLNTNAA